MQEHQYLEGYYVGGKIPPFYRGKRPNKFGYALVPSSIMFVLGWLANLIAVWGGTLDPHSLGSVLFMGGFSALQIIAGVRMLRNSPQKKGPQRHAAYRSNTKVRSGKN